MASLNLSTVHRTLTLFERLQIVHTLALGGRVTYAAWPITPTHTPSATAAPASPPSATWGDLLALVRRNLAGFAPTGIVIRGRCADCPPPRISTG